MRQTARGLLALGLVLSLVVVALAQDDKDMVENPKYKFWGGFKANATSTYVETTKFHGPEKENYPGGVDVKRVSYKLQSVNKDKAVVTTTVTEDDFLGSVESAPTKLHYPARIKKANLEAALQEFGTKEGGSEKVKVGKEVLECKVLAGTYKKGGMTIEYKMCFSDAVPGGVVKRTRKTKDGDKLVVETDIVLQSYTVPKAKDKDKE